MAALLFKVEAAVRLGYTSRACTELPCCWNNDFVKKVKPATIHNIKFYKKSAIDKVQKKRYPAPVASTSQEQQQLLTLLADCSRPPIGLSLFKEHSSLFRCTATAQLERLPQPLTALFKMEYASLPKPELDTEVGRILPSITVTDAEVRYVDKCTQNQAACLTWFQMRAGRITASRAHAVLHTRLDHPSASLLQGICSDVCKPFYSAATTWGKEDESDALLVYRNTSLEQGGHVNFQLNKTGLRLCREFPYIGASADSVAWCDCHGSRVVEVKCPYKHRDSTIDEMTSDPTFCLGKDLHLKRKHSYYTQTQLQMYVYGVSKCDFVVWSRNVCLIVEVVRDTDFVSDMVPKLCTFFRQCVLPEMMTRHMLHATSTTTTSGPSHSVPPVSTITSAKVYCSCRMPADDSDLDDDMIGCDTPQCPHGEWFHFSCLKMKRAPKGSWFCPGCRKRKH